MKKLFWIVPATFLLLLLIVILLIPSQPVVSQKINLHATQNGLVKLLSQKDKWQQWWPASKEEAVYDSLNFSYQQQLLKTAILHLPFRDTFLVAQLNTVYYEADSSAVLFQTVIPVSSNPLQKIANYFESRKISRTAGTILQRLKSFAEKEENIYGFSVRQERVKDSALVATRFASAAYPGPDSIYLAVAALRSYIGEQGAKETGEPMLHAEKAENGQYSVMVAIPVNRVLEGNDQIKPKRMVLGKILVTEVKGGPHTVEQALQTFEQYLIDHKRTAPAISYESLLTNRQEEPDTSKWMTRLYYPVL